MTICGECGARNAPGTQFCGECGTFLEWEDQAATPADAAAAQVGTAPGGVPPASIPEVVQPGEAQHRRRVPVPDEAGPVSAGDVACRHCGAGNAPTRKFCRSCAGQLAPDVAPARRSWWARMWDRLTARRSREAGTRRRVRAPRRWPRRLAVIGVLAALAVAAVTVLPTRGLANRLVTNVRDRLSDHVPITPVAVRASSSAPGAPPGNVKDGASNRYWAPAGAARGAWVEVDLGRAARLLDVVVTPGVSADKRQFLTQGRPRELIVTVTNRSGRTTDATITLRDAPGGQTFPVKVSDAVKVRLTIAGTYGMPPGQRCGIGELEFFIRS
jgi:ribosomal protein L40E